MTTEPATIPAAPWVQAPSQLIAPLAAKPPIELNDEQIRAVDMMMDFLSDPETADMFFVLSGPAGTGKTFCMREVASRFRTSHGKIIYTAPTNKAAKVLRGITGAAQTIYSALGLRISTNGELKELDTGKPVDLSGYDAIVVDEGGMTSKILMMHLRDAVEKFGFKVIFMADSYQLPPVKEIESPIWRIKTGTALTRVMRHDNQILQLVTRIRTAMDLPIMNIDIKTDNNGVEGVWKVGKADFKKRIYDAAIAGEFIDTNKVKVIAWRNVKCAEYNQLIRSAIFGAGADTYEIGDRIIAASPCMQGDEAILPTDEEALVESVVVCKHPLEPQYAAYELKCRTEQNKVIRLLTLHPSSKLAYDNACQTLAHAAKANGKLWEKYWNLKDLFHDIKYGYCITAHRAQGSTYETVYADYQDILLNRERREAFQCLYVACSRPTKRLILA